MVKLAALLAAILLLPLLAVGALTLRDDGLAETERSAQPVVTSPTPRTVTDERQARIVASAIPGPDISAGAARGTVTAVHIAPGDTIEDGAVLFQADGIDRIGVASPIPFYRPITPGAEGADVAALNALLIRKGILDKGPADPALATFATGQAIADLAETLGAPRTTTFDPAWVVFLPATGLTAETVDLKVGQQAPSQGAVIITTPGTVTAARIVSGNQEPVNFATGVEYIAVVDGEELAIDTAAQSIAAADVPRLRAPKETERDGIPALTRRKTALQALAIPSSAVMTNASGTLCAWLVDGEGYRAANVTVAGARAGVTNVATGLSPQDQVLANPSVLEAPQCP